MRVLPLFAGAIFFTPAALAAPKQSLEAEATITVRADRIIGRTNPLIFGANLEAGDPKGIFGNVSVPALTRTGAGVWDDTKMAPSGAAKWAREAGVSLWRFPGGCLAHNYDWKKTIGPLDKRGDFRFGVDEFLKLCAATHAAPLFTLPDYSGTPQDAADLVEYLNAPADARHPWARQRAQNGHPAPYGVKWLELGNESNHGNHALLPPRRFSPEQYADYARRMAEAMKRVDPSVRIGIVTAAGMPPDDAWNPVVFVKCGSFADFVVVHHYAVNYQSDDPNVDEGKLMTATMASGEQLEHQLTQYRALIARYAKRPLPLALTEFNVGFVQQQPKPYRFSWGGALWSADYARVLLQPQNHVLMANYWQFANGYWGQIEGEGDHWTPRPAFAAFKMWTRFGSQLLDTQTHAPTQPFDGFGSTQMARGPKFQAAQPLGPPNLLSAPLQTPTGAGFSTQSDPNGVTVLTLSDFKGAGYPLLSNVSRPAAAGPQGARYHLSFQARWVPGKESGPIRLGLGLMDARGWEKTSSAVAVMGAEGARGWQSFESFFEALPDAPGVAVLARLEGGDSGATGRLELRGIVLSATSNTLYPAYSLLTSTASLSGDGKSLYVMVFNKSADRDLVTAVQLGAFVPRQTRAWTLSAPSFTSLDVSANGVHEEFAALPNPKNGVLLHTFPARSMTALEFRLTPAPNPKNISNPIMKNPIPTLVAGALLAASSALPVVAAPKAPVPATATPVSLVANGDFENDLTGWTAWNDGIAAKMDTGAPAHGGKKAASVVVPDGERAASFLQFIGDPVPAKEGDKLMLSFWVKANSTSNAPMNGAFATLEGIGDKVGADGQPERLGAVATQPVRTGEWVKQTLSWTVPAGSGQMRVRLFFSGTGTARFDDVTLTPNAPANAPISAKPTAP